MANAPHETDLQYYLYMSDDWRGPYPLAQIRSFLKLGQIDEATYAYEPQHQSQLTVGDLLAGRKVMPQDMGTGAASGIGSSGSRQAIEPQPATARFTARTSGRLDDAINAVAVMRKVCFTIRDASGRERDDLLDDLKLAVDTVREVLERLRGTPAELRNFAVQVDKAASDVAARLSDRALTAHLVDLRECITHADPDEIVPATDAIIAQMAHLARTADEDNPFQIVDDEATPDHGHPIDAYESARYELKGLQTDLSTVKEAYEKLQEAYAKEQKQARKLLLQLREQLESEQNAHAGDNAELRALAAEIHDLASACGLADVDPALAQDLGRLAEELQHTVPTSLVPVAESVLNRMVGRLASEQSHANVQIEEMSAVRAELLQLKTDMSILRQKEEQLQADKSRLQKQLDEERGAANRVDQSARAREAQLKSTIAALQVTKELHQEVMADLQEQLQSAGERVEDMERELLTARNELKGTRSNFVSREQQLVQDLEALSRERADLEARQKHLSDNLVKAESELVSAKERAAQSDEDESLAEALAAKVTQLRDAFEQTRTRLRDQEGNASTLQQELAAARAEAQELRSRSDQLSSELDGARGNLDAARKRMDELQRAAARLEAERSALQSELSERKGTDSILKSEVGGGHLQTVVAQLEAQVASAKATILDLEGQLAAERSQAAQWQREHSSTDARHGDLLAERERLRGEIEALRSSGGSTARVTDLEQRLDEAERSLRDTGEARSDLQAKLVSTAAERDRLNGELIRLRTEHEAAAVEHRAAIAAARKAQTEAAARAAELKAELATANAERERLHDEVSAQRSTLATSADSESRLGALGQRLSTESARADALACDLDQARRNLAASTVKLERLTEEFNDSERERERLSSEINRKHDASSMRDAVDASGRSKLQEAIDRLREQLEREQRRSTDLEHRLEAARSEARNAATRHADTAGSYADAVARADRFASEASELRARHAAELAEAEQRLATERERARTLETRLGTIDSQLAASAARQQGLERSLAELTAERERLSRDATSLREAKVDAEAKSADLARRLRSTETELAELRDEVNQAQEQRHVVANELASTTGRHSRLAVTVDRLSKELTQARSDLATASTEHEAALQAVKGRLEAERATIAELQTRIADVERARDEALSRSELLQQRLDTADHARITLITETDALRAQLAHTASAVKAGAVDPSEVAALRQRLGEAETRLRASQAEHEATAKRGADRLIELEARLHSEQAKVADLETLREQLRKETAGHSEARATLAAVTATRDLLQADLERITSELRTLKDTAARSQDQTHALADVQALLAAEKARVAQLEADLAIARSNQQVALAGREGLETSLSKVVADRERLLAEVDRLRRDLDQLRGQMRIAAPEQQAEISMLKQMLTMERERVSHLEERLAEAWRKQGETMALTDSELRRRLDRADEEIRTLRNDLREERRKSEHGDSPSSQRIAVAAPPPKPSADPLAEAAHGSSASRMAVLQESEIFSGLRPSVAVHQAGALDPRGNERPQLTPNSPIPGFTSAFGRPSVTASLPQPGSIHADAGDRPLTRRSRRHLPSLRTRIILAGAALTALTLTLLLPALYPICTVGRVTAEVDRIVAPIDGTLYLERTATAGRDIQGGDRLGVIRNDDVDTTILDRRAQAVKGSLAKLNEAEADLAAARSDLDRKRTLWQDQVESLREAITGRLLDAEVALTKTKSTLSDLQRRALAGEAGLDLSIAAATQAVHQDEEALAAMRARLEALVLGLSAEDSATQKALREQQTQVATLTAGRDQAAADVQAAEAALAEETERVNRLRESPIVATSDGRIWRHLSIDRKQIRANDVLMETALPGSIVVETVLGDNLGSITTGQQVEVALIGSSAHITGRIIAILRPDEIPAGSSYPLDPVIGKFHRALITLEPSFDTSLLGVQSARVMIMGQDPGALRLTVGRLYAWLRL